MIPHYPSFYKGGSYSKMDTLYLCPTYVYVVDRSEIKSYNKIRYYIDHCI